MSGGFKDREKGFEAKWAHDEEMRFKVYARRNRLLGLWAGEEMGLSAATAEVYAKTVVEADLKHAGHEDVFAKIRADFDKAKIAHSDHIIRRKMQELLAAAVDEVARDMRK